MFCHVLWLFLSFVCFCHHWKSCDFVIMKVMWLCHESHVTFCCHESHVTFNSHESHLTISDVITSFFCILILTFLWKTINVINVIFILLNCWVLIRDLDYNGQYVVHTNAPSHWCLVKILTNWFSLIKYVNFNDLVSYFKNSEEKNWFWNRQQKSIFLTLTVQFVR